VGARNANGSDPSRARRLLKRAAWRTLYPRWRGGTDAAEGYTILIPVPGDLPVFTHLALAGLARQDPDGRTEIIVIPDRSTPDFASTLAQSAALFPPGVVRPARIGARARAIQRVSGDPSLNHFFQLFHGITAARTKYAVLHDVDLFINDVGFLAERYRRCRDDGLACLGLELVFNDEWYERHGLGPVLATWELMFEIDWLRAFPPWQAHLHYRNVNGGVHMFDTMDYPQVHIPSERRRLAEAPDAFVHFRQVITVFRRFQLADGRPYEDVRFRLLLIRLLMDAFGGSDSRLPPPPVDELARGITDASAPVTYRSPGIEANYSSFRLMLGFVTAGPLVDPDRAERIERALAPFDAAFG
jgi:hypothetical protein